MRGPGLSGRWAAVRWVPGGFGDRWPPFLMTGVAQTKQRASLGTGNGEAGQKPKMQLLVSVD